MSSSIVYPTNTVNFESYYYSFLVHLATQKESLVSPKHTKGPGVIRYFAIPKIKLTIWRHLVSDVILLVIREVDTDSH